MLPGDFSWEKILRRCLATKPVPRKHGNDVDTGIDTSAKAFSSDITQMICFFQDYFENSREFCSVKHFCSKGQ
jgi:hypothetical protein